MLPKESYSPLPPSTKKLVNSVGVWYLRTGRHLMENAVKMYSPRARAVRENLDEFLTRLVYACTHRSVLSRCLGHKSHGFHVKYRVKWNNLCIELHSLFVIEG